MPELAYRGGAPVRATPFAPWPQYSQADVSRLLEVVENRNWGGFPFPNRWADEFATKFAAYHDAEYGVGVCNGTIALELACKAVDLKFGDEVIVPAYTWDGTAAAILFAGGVPIFVDVLEDSFCIDVSKVEAAITQRTRALMPVHLAMRFSDMHALGEIARRHGLAVIEDCAHAHGGKWQSRGAGSMGDLGCFSLQSSKLMTAGEGGIVITNRPDCYEVLQSYTNCGRASTTDRYQRRVLGGNYRMTELQAALLIGQLERLPQQTERRSRNAARLTEGLKRISNVKPLAADPRTTQAAVYQYVFLYQPVDSPVSRDVFVAALEAEGVPCDGRFYEAVYRSDLFPVRASDFPALAHDRPEPVDYSKFHCPVAERLAYQESVWLPHFLLLGDDGDVDDLLAAIEKVATHLEELEGIDAGVKGRSRADRPRIEKQRQW